MSENNILDTAKTLGFGTELEYTHISREGAARAIQIVCQKSNGIDDFF